MKKVFVSFLACVAMIGVVLNFCSCGKEADTPPNVAFQTSVSYVSKDTSLLHGTVFNIGVNASKTGTEGLLTSCKISRSVNGAADSTIQEMNFVSEVFSQVYSYQAGDSGSTERYTFTIGEQGGLTNSVSLTITDI